MRLVLFTLLLGGFSFVFLRFIVGRTEVVKVLATLLTPPPASTITLPVQYYWQYIGILDEGQSLAISAVSFFICRSCLEQK